MDSRQQAIIEKHDARLKIRRDNYHLQKDKKESYYSLHKGERQQYRKERYKLFLSADSVLELPPIQSTDSNA